MDPRTSAGSEPTMDRAKSTVRAVSLYRGDQFDQPPRPRSSGVVYERHVFAPRFANSTVSGPGYVLHRFELVANIHSEISGPGENGLRGSSRVVVHEYDFEVRRLVALLKKRLEHAFQRLGATKRTNANTDIRMFHTALPWVGLDIGAFLTGQAFIP
jgi:hypothetical protein